MKLTCELDTDDVKEIIAKHFGCETSSVKFVIDVQRVGHGMGEHDEYTPRWTVTKS